MSDRLGIILVRKDYVEKFKASYRTSSYHGLVNVWYWNNKDFKSNTIMTPYEVRCDDKGARLRSILNGSVKLFKDSVKEYEDDLSLTYLKPKTICRYLDWDMSGIQLAYDKIMLKKHKDSIDKIFINHYESRRNTKKLIEENPDYCIIMGIN